MCVLSIDKSDGGEGRKAEQHLTDDGALVYLTENVAVGRIRAVVPE